MIIQIALAECADEENTYGTLVALTDDGQVWLMHDPWNVQRRKWQKLPDLPAGERPWPARGSTSQPKPTEC